MRRPLVRQRSRDAAVPMVPGSENSRRIVGRAFENQRGRPRNGLVVAIGNGDVIESPKSPEHGRGGSAEEHDRPERQRPVVDRDARLGDQLAVDGDPDRESGDHRAAPFQRDLVSAHRIPLRRWNERTCLDARDHTESAENKTSPESMTEWSSGAHRQGEGETKRHWEYPAAEPPVYSVSPSLLFT